MEVSQIMFKLLSLFVFFIVNSSSSNSSHPPQGRVFPYMTANVDEISGKSFDYIVVGGGASGCPLAATLSERFSVLLIERGDSPYQNPLILEKKNYGVSLIRTNEFSSIAQSFVSTDGVSNYRGRVLGGGTAINGGFYSRASENYVKKVGWNERLVKEAYEWVEKRIVFKPELSLWQSVAESGLLEAEILPNNGFSYEHLEGTKIGGSIFDVYGRRHVSADLLGAGNPENVTVLLNATVKSVIFHKTGNVRAYGIRFIKSNGNIDQEYEAYLNQPSDTSSSGEVIISAGTLGSPQILLLSGLGPKKHLQNLKIPLVLDIKGVGQRMKDNPCISIRVDTKLHLRKTHPPQVVGVANNFKFIVQSLIRPVSHNQTNVHVASKLAFFASKGKLELKNKDPRQNPLVTFNYLSKKKDLKKCVKMSMLVHHFAKTKSINKFLGNQYNGTSLNSTSTEDEMRTFCLKNVKTFFHYHGGCADGSVVDEDYKVYGVEGLRVVDGSTFLESPGTNPMATVLMLGRYQGIKILAERRIILLAQKNDRENDT